MCCNHSTDRPLSYSSKFIMALLETLIPKELFTATQSNWVISNTAEALYLYSKFLRHTPKNSKGRVCDILLIPLHRNLL